MEVRIYGHFGPPFLLMKSTNSSPCLTSVYKAWSYLGARIISVPFDAQWIITVNDVFGNSGRLLLAFLPLRSPTSAKCKSVWKPHANLPDTPVDLTSASKYFQMLPGPLELSRVLSDSAKAYSGAPESTCSYGGAFTMLRDLTYRIVKFWSSWDHCTALRETSCRILTAVVLGVP